MADEKLEKSLTHLKHLYSLECEMVRANAAFEHASLRPLFILNGGALVVYLALFGGARGLSLDLSVGRIAIISWVSGIVLATVATSLSALSQSAFRSLRGQLVAGAEIELGMQEGSAADAARESGKYAARGVCFRNVAVALGVLSVLAFLGGFWPAFLSVSR